MSASPFYLYIGKGQAMNVSANIRKLTNLLIALFLALSAGLVYWQVVVAQQVTANEHNSRSCFSDTAPVRGRIFDRNGVLLAESKADPNGICGYVRTYYDPSLAGLIGYYVPGYTITGIEKQYDDILSGRTGSTELGNTINSILHRPPVGSDIYLTIDDRIQKIADQHFDDPTQETRQSNRGAAIVTDPHTGEILAMVSRPSFDPNKMVQTLQKHDTSYYDQLAQDTTNNPLLERPLQGRYVPGSTYKTLTLLAGLDTNKTTLNQEFQQKQALGPITIDGQQIGPEGNNISGYTKHFPVDTEYGFTHSDNIIFAQIAVETGVNNWLDYNKRFYVGLQTPFDLPVAVSQVLPAGQDTMADNQLAADGFGQGTDFITPFTMSLIEDAIANNGQLMRPRLLLKVTDRQGNLMQSFGQQVLGNPISNQTATEARQAMYGVTRCGSGSIVAALVGSKTSIIAKTGTAQVGGAGTFPHGWMITAAPYSVATPNQLPALTMVAMKENDGEGAEAVGPMIAHTYEDIFSKGYVSAQLPSIPGQVTYCGKTGLLQYK
jgi:penicillin-binding protein A